MEENAAPAGGESTGATTTESVASEEFDYRSPAEISAAEAEESKGSEEEEADEEAEENEDVEETNSKTDDGKTQEATQTTETKTEAPSQSTDLAKEVVKQIEVNLPVDENGQIDVSKLPQFADDLIAAAQAKAEAVINNAKYFENEENSVKQAFPAIAKDPDLMKMVKDLRTADALTGGKGDLMEHAKTIADRLNLEMQKGKQSAKQSITRQKSARLETGKRTVANGESAKLRKLTDVAFRSPDRSSRESARIERIKMLRSSGQL